MQINKSVDALRFIEARATVLGESASPGGIGTLSEKSLHGILKYYIEPNSDFHEVEFLGSVADIKREWGIVEIQTRSLERLAPKLEKFLAVMPVRVVYPLPYEKYISLIDKESGEIISRRKSPKRSTPADAIIELRKIKKYLTHENFSLTLFFLNVDEYRTRTTKKRGNRIATVREERIPSSIEYILNFDKREDYLQLLPSSLPCEFTVAELSKAAKLKKRWGYDIVSLLSDMELISFVGKRGREHLYSKKK
ncbi:MAG: hypothetical protein IJY65_04715 [Clostridia bacterium]|nr:hypothetical protein [Clostridia bacterium]